MHSIVLELPSTYLRHGIGVMHELQHSYPSLCPVSLLSSRNISMYFRQRRETEKFRESTFAVLPSTPLFISPYFQFLSFDLLVINIQRPPCKAT